MKEEITPQSTNVLQVPSNSTSQTRRKRGLSLRSQMFKKNLNKPNDPIELETYVNPSDTNLENGTHNQTDTGTAVDAFPNAPQIKIDESEIIRNYQPYNTLSTKFTRSTSHLSDYSENSSVEFLSKDKKHSNPRFLHKLLKLKDRIIGNLSLPPTVNGRVIPLTVNPTQFELLFGKGYFANSELVDERTNCPYISNAITSSKYSVYSFLPKQLKAQFSKVANCYFMVVAIMQIIPNWSTTGHFTTIIPLMIFMSISIAREGFDDWKRHIHDKEENNNLCHRIEFLQEDSTYDTTSINTLDVETISLPHNAPSISPPKPKTSHINDELSKYNLSQTKVLWKDIRVGDIIKIHEDEWVPADIILLSSFNEDESDTAYVETMALDGETNLKSKFSCEEVSRAFSQASEMVNFNNLVTVEDPNSDLYNFEGLINVFDETHPLGPDNIIYRGSILRNTKSVLGLVVFSGEETKIRMNNIKNPRTKAPKLQKNINYIVAFMVVVVASLAAFSTMAERLFYSRYKQLNWYLYQQDAGVAATFMGFIIMYNTLIPLSLYVTMEIIKLGQLLLLQCDIDMYHQESNTPANAKTATILEELGQVSHIFSDKTGTLTDNLMLFRKFSVNGLSWLHDIDLAGNEMQYGNMEAFPTTDNPSTELKNIIDTQEISQKSISRKSTTSLVRASMDARSLKTSATWKSTAQPQKVQTSMSSLGLLKYIQTHPNTLFAKKAKFFLLSIALCSTCLPKRTSSDIDSGDASSFNLKSDESSNNIIEDQNIVYQSSSPDEKALVEAARDLGFIVYDKKSSTLTIKTYPQGFDNTPKYEDYVVLDVIEFSSARKRMSIIVKFPDSRICLICKGADSIIIEKLKNSELAKQKAKEITLNATERKNMEADIVLQQRFSHEAQENGARDSIGSLSSIRKSLHLSGNLDRSGTLRSIDGFLFGENEEQAEINEVIENSRKSLHYQQAQRYSLDNKDNKIGNSSKETYQKLSNDDVFDDRLLVNDEYLIEKTLEHIEEFSVEGLRTLLYSFKWLSHQEYETFKEKYQIAKSALVDRTQQVEEVGESIENNFELLGATAIEDKLQDGVSDAIEKFRKAGIKMWMLTGDKRETAINIGYSCTLIKDFSTVTILNIDFGKDQVKTTIVDTIKKVQGGSIAHCVVVIDGATLSVIEHDENLMHHLIDLCVLADSAICCRASPSQKAKMVSSIRNINKRSVTLAIGDGANDIAMIQSADIGVGITGKEGLQAARASDYTIAQFKFLLKLLLVNGRYNYIRTSKFVLCTFYKELLFYLTQVLYQRNTLFSGSSVYESWSLSMYNTLFTSLPVLVIGIFDKDLKPATLLAAPELYNRGRLFKAFNLKVFVSWMLLATVQSVGISFLSWNLWGFTALRDNTTFPLGTLLFTALVIIINAKCELIEMQNRNWLSFAAFIISVGGYGLWNVIIMMLYRTKPKTIFYVEYGLLEFGQDASWWSTLLVLFTIPLLVDILIKVFKFVIKPLDDEIFKAIERDIEMRKDFEFKSFKYLNQGWSLPRESSIWRIKFIGIVNFIGKKLGINFEMHDKNSIEYRKRAGTSINETELPPSSEGNVIYNADYDNNINYEVLPSGKRVKVKRDRSNSIWNKFKKESDEDIEAIISDRLRYG